MKPKMIVLAILLVAGPIGLGWRSVQAAPGDATVVSKGTVRHLEVHQGTADYERTRQWWPSP